MKQHYLECRSFNFLVFLQILRPALIESRRDKGAYPSYAHDTARRRHGTLYLFASSATLIGILTSELLRPPSPTYFEYWSNCRAAINPEPETVPYSVLYKFCRTPWQNESFATDYGHHATHLIRRRQVQSLEFGRGHELYCDTRESIDRLKAIVKSKISGLHEASTRNRTKSTN